MELYVAEKERRFWFKKCDDAFYDCRENSTVGG